ncbi:MAG: NUDIX domain-containing protein [Candidatus Absconditabacterales bacterium]
MAENTNVGVGFGVMILREGKVLLGQRHVDPVKASSELHGEGTRTMPGGKMRFHESFEELCARETLEETGLTINTDTIKIISITNDIVPDKHFITIGFLCEDSEGEPQVMEPDEITQWKRFDLHNLPTPLFFPSKKLIKNYLDGVLYRH